MTEDTRDQVTPSAADSDRSASDVDILGFGRPTSTDVGSTSDGSEAGGGKVAAGSGTGTGADGEGGKAESTEAGDGQGKAEGARAAGQPRDAQGRFVSSAQQAGSSQAGAEKFVFLNEEFDSREQAEQKWRSYFGSVKAWEDRHNQLKRQYDELQRKLEEQEKAAPPESRGASEDAKAAAQQVKKELGPLAELVDYDLLQEIFDDPTLGPKRAFQYLAMKVDEYLQSAKESWKETPQQDPRLERIFKDHEDQELFVETVRTFEELHNRVDSSGRKLYPRLADADFTARMTQLYLGDADLRSRGVYGAHLAYLDLENWERYMAGDIKGHQVSTPGNGKAPAAQSGPPKLSTEPQDHVISGSDTPALVTQGRKGDRFDREFAELEAFARSRGDGVLGF